MTTVVPKQRCSHCGYRLDRSTSAYGHRRPKPGDASICAACGALGVVQNDLTLREPTIDERALMESDPLIIEAQIMRAHMLGDQLKPKRKRKRP